jgi:hypothetical protein
MRTIQINTEDKKSVQNFIKLPFTIYKFIPQWIPPLEGDVSKALDRNRNPFFRHSDAAFFLTLNAEDQPIGRLAVIDNRNYNEYNHERTAFFWYFECINDFNVSHQLFQNATDWVKQRGLNQVIGPKGFTALDGLGLLVKGFDYQPAFGIPYNPKYYMDFVEGEGFQISNDIVSGYMSGDFQFPEKILKAAELIKKRKGLSVARFKHRSDLLSLVSKLKDLYNGALIGTSGNTPLTDDEARSMANQILWLADPRFIKILMKGDDPVGFLFAYPDISAAVKRQNGKLFPFGWIDIFKEMQATKWININGAGILEEYRGMGGTAILFSEMYKSIVEGHFQHADIVQIGIENDRMQNELRSLGVKFYKTHRMYHKEL